MKKVTKTAMNYLKALILPFALYLFLLLLIPDRVGNLNSLNIMLIMSVVPAILACGVSFGFISGLMDFSIGSRVILAGLVGAICADKFGFIGLFLGCVLTSLLLAAITGGVFWMFKIPSLVVSLGLMMIFEITGNTLCHSAARFAPDASTGYYIKIPASLTFLGNAPGCYVVLLITLAVFYFVYYRTKFSNQARVVGSDELIARNVGINPMKVKFVTYLVGGFFLGIAAMVSACYSGAVGAQTNMATMAAVFRPMMAIVIGISLQKLVPIPVGIFIGVFSLNIIFTGIIALGWSDDLQNVVLGFFLVIVVAFPTVWKNIQDNRRRKQVRKDFAEKQTETASA